MRTCRFVTMLSLVVLASSCGYKRPAYSVGGSVPAVVASDVTARGMAGESIDGKRGESGWLKVGKNVGGQEKDHQQLIKKGSLTLIVGEARKAEERLKEILKGYDAYISARQSNATVPQSKYLKPSEVSSITLTIKVEARRFDEFLAQVKQIGSYTHESVQTEDVTFAHADLTARLANQKKVEERLLGHLSDRARDFKSVLEIEKELSRVREQIEQLTAQLRSMENQIAYSTLTLQISVQPEYVPPSQRTFGQDVKETFSGSLGAMGTTARTLAIAAVAILPWLLVAALLLWGLVRLIGWISSRRARPKPAPPAQ
ncbi:MAG: DUF4349 domain-containing protein [Deltaproteobacteria bacterium]|nr:DUF4349 domain-containing protein [Deltaproteobacteria bacterium]